MRLRRAGKDNQKASEWVVSYRQLGLLFLVFVLGLISALLISNAQTGTPTTFTTTELIGFVLSVVLAGASIVLAVTAIALGKSSEQAVIKRSDESIRLQNEVFIKTTEALQRIEASTGVTEKRIEDIISGRVGDISHQIAEMATSGGKRRPRDVRELEKSIHQSLIKTIRSEESEEELKERKRLKEEKKKEEEVYQKSHERLMYGVANKENTSITKIGHGTVPGDGDDLFDGIFDHNNERLAVSTFRPDASEEMFTEFIASAASVLSKGDVGKIYMVLFERKDDDEIIGEINDHLRLLREELSSKITVKTVEYENIDDWVAKVEL